MQFGLRRRRGYRPVPGTRRWLLGCGTLSLDLPRWRQHLVYGFVYGRDTYIVPSNAGCFAFISHDEFWCVATRKPEIHDRLMQDFEKLEPRVDSVKRRFCRSESNGPVT
jgi:hypothetical protein